MDKGLEEKIIVLRKKGYSYRKIQKKLGCSRSTISYHLGKGQKEKTKLRALKRIHKARDYGRKSFEYLSEYIWRVKKMYGCKDCGEKDPIVLDFDHIDRDLKYLSISVLKRRRVSIQFIKEEIRKCEVRCSNCHRKKTHKEFGYRIYD